jgi:hypothetical protein
MAKRRQALGLGQSYGQTQAANIFGQGLMDNPQAVQENIRMGMAGSPEQLTPLLAAGVNPFGADAGKAPDEIMDRIIEKMPEVLNRAGPGKQLLMAQAFGYDKLGFSPMDILRFSKKENVDEYKQEEEMKKHYKPLMDITPKAQKAWMEFELQLQAAGAQIQSVFGEALAPLMGPLKRLSDAFAHFVRILMDSPVVKKILDNLASWIDSLAASIKNLREKDITNWLNDLLPVWEGAKTAMSALSDVVSDLAIAIKWLTDNYKEMNDKYTELRNASPFKKILPEDPKKLLPNMNPLNPLGGLIPWDFTLPGMISNAIHWYRGDTPPPAAPAAASGQQSSLTQPPPSTQVASNTNINMASWSVAASNKVPRTQTADNMNSPRSYASQAMSQPLSSNNWQMSRTASLVVRNVPGANIFMTAAGMTA